MNDQVVNDSRRLWKYIVFGALTFGIYCIWFDYTLIKDLNRACGYVEESEEYASPHYLIRLLLSVITFGIYMIFWYYKQGQRLKDAGRKYDCEIDDEGSTYILWILLGSLLLGIGPLIAFYIFLCNCNKIFRCYNRIIGNGEGKVRQKKEKYSYDLRRSDGNRTPVIPSYGRIRFTKGSMSGAELNLRDGETVIIGRDAARSQMILADKDISRLHCAIHYSRTDDCYYVTDYSSLGTFISGSVRLAKEKPTRCPVGTFLTLGKGSNELQLR